MQNCRDLLLSLFDFKKTNIILTDYANLARLGKLEQLDDCVLKMFRNSSVFTFLEQFKCLGHSSYIEGLNVGCNSPVPIGKIIASSTKVGSNCSLTAGCKRSPPSPPHNPSQPKSSYTRCILLIFDEILNLKDNVIVWFCNDPTPSS